ncbi:3-phosphoserine/phosphohydroxythreonine transaminase [Trinickia caryophylli]|nr:3-phosphoserine/phosphohydroxythreonine transaminase [Trinickia caryophylli]TRX20342.1 3-phosphoserine/phosphohydroxythreonine transaminase [Trinickia caryophylli]
MGSSARRDARWNFGAGPSRLPDAVLAQAGERLLTRAADGMAAIERPFTGAAYREVLAEARGRLARLLGVPDHYRVLFLAGGASLQFSAVPMNLLDPSSGLCRGAYADSGYWSRRAIAEASRHAKTSVVARPAGSGEAGGGEPPLATPQLDGWHLPRDSAYCHITANETADGIAYPAWPETGGVPLVADASSCLLSAPMDVSRFGLIYASAQKNIGPSGLTLVIVREDLLHRPASSAPAPLQYRTQADAESCASTPPMLAVHLAALVFEWIEACGGLAAMAAANARKASLLYRAIDESGGFYVAPVEPGHRSITNIRFHLDEASLTERFMDESEAAGLLHLRGHPRLGGVRASLYNAMPEAGAQALAGFMIDFAKRYR